MLRGLNNEYKTKVKTQYPKTLEDAIKSAQIFYDSLDKSSSVPAWGKSASHGYAFKSRKRKIDTNSKEDVSKNPKGFRGPLSSDEFAPARRDKLCFQCLGSHERKDCPQLKDNTADKNKGKEKALHTVKLLPLEAFSKYVTVEVSHQALEHECCLTVSPWQPTFGPHELFRFHGTINGRRVRVLVGSSGYSLVHRPSFLFPCPPSVRVNNPY